VQDELPGTLTLPASHCNEEFGERHNSSLSLRLDPTLTCWQSAALSEPTTVLYDPAAQLAQAATPLVALNLPATHSSHSSPGRKVHDTPTS
jgi:hypothetical protein